MKKKKNLHRTCVHNGNIEYGCGAFKILFIDIKITKKKNKKRIELSQKDVVAFALN